MTAPELTSYVVAGAGLAVAAVWRMRVRAGSNPLGPRPAGELPDLRVPLLIGLVLWWGFDFGVVYAARELSLTTTRYMAALCAVHILAAAVLYAWVRRWPPSPLPPARRAAAGVLGGVATYGIVGVIGLVLMAGYALANVQIPTQDVVRIAARAQGAELIVTVALACVIAPLWEEMLYRGTMLPVLARGAPMRTAITMQAVLFGCLHFFGKPPATWPLAIPLAAVGWCAGWLAVRTSSIWPAVLLHATFNALNLAFLRWSGGAV